MSKNNDVFQVLVAPYIDGETGLLAKDKKVDDLDVGQIGVFDASTNLSIDGTVAVKDFFLAVGVDDNADGVMDNIVTSAGQYIQRRYIRGYSFRPHTAGRPMIFELTNFSADCNSDYTLNLNFRNSEILRTQGYNQFKYSYNVKTSCCEGCDDCPSGDCIELAEKIVDVLNADEMGLVEAVAISPFTDTLEVTHVATAGGDISITIGGVETIVTVTTAMTITDIADLIATTLTANTALSDYGFFSDGISKVSIVRKSGGGVTFTFTFADTDTTGVTVTTPVDAVASEVTDYTTFKSDFPGICLGVKVTTKPLAINKFCSVNTKFHKLLETIVMPSLAESFECNGTLTVTQDPVFEEGSGVNIQQKEFYAGGWNGSPGPYRVSSATGLARNGFVYRADADEKYDVIALTYDQLSTAGWAENFNNLATEIAIPEANKTVTIELLTVLDRIAHPLGFDELADDAAAASTTSTVIERTQDRDDVALDGIG